jgi:hypothetical protein
MFLGVFLPKMICGSWGMRIFGFAVELFAEPFGSVRIILGREKGDRHGERPLKPFDLRSIGIHKIRVLYDRPAQVRPRQIRHPKTRIRQIRIA